jgi:N-methylhydantoinase B/oxoprolinase/acetone carboxylase alpha subunit
VTNVPNPGAKLDPITLDIMWGRLIATVNEQAAALIRSSFTSIVRDAGDLSACVFDRRGRMVAQAVTGSPGHINSMATGMAHIVEAFPVDTLRPGDVIITNDPWITVSQLHDITIATPVFHKGRVVGLFANCCHALDIGGRGLSADARSIYEEGLLIPIMKLHDAGKPVDAVYRFIAANVRTPDEVVGDIHAQIIANEVGGGQGHA